MLDLHIQKPQTPQDQEHLTRDIAATDRQIDALVYQLYGTCPSSSGVSDEEIKIVEGAGSSD